MTPAELAARMNRRLVESPFVPGDEAVAEREGLVAVFGIDEHAIVARGALRAGFDSDPHDSLVLVPRWPDTLALAPDSFFRANPDAPRIRVDRFADDGGEDECPLEWTIRIDEKIAARGLGFATLRMGGRLYPFSQVVVFSIHDLPDAPRLEFFGEPA
jgi:hypothetical protein